MNDVSSDGDGILDAEELMPLTVSVKDLESVKPAPFEKKGKEYKKYSDYWGAGTYHDINNDDTKGWFVRNDLNLALDPTCADTDGDGVPDGVEVTDNANIGRTDADGNSLGYWPSEVKDFNPDESTNPLDPNDN